MLLTRLSAFFDELKSYPFRHAALFAHGGILACAQIYSGDIRPEEAFNFTHPFGSIISIEI
jgi:alpha-ribazole phosphatase